MENKLTLGETLQQRGISRRSFLKFCSVTASMLALPASAVPRIAEALQNTRRPSVIWLSFQECTGCSEALTRSHSPSIEGLIFDYISLDYLELLQAAAGEDAEHARHAAMKDNWGEYLLIVDGSIPLGEAGMYSTVAGVSNLKALEEAAEGAKAILPVGTCAAYGGLPMANPNPTNAVAVSDIVTDKPIVNIPGCPPIPSAMTGVLVHFLTFNRLPALDPLGRPLAFFGQNIHDRCYRRPFYERGQFADSFDDEGAKKGWCLYKLGCRGPTTYNACAVSKWNGGVSFPIQAGHGCIGCSEPRFWDAGGFYQALSQATFTSTGAIGSAAVAGAAVGAGAAFLARGNKGNTEEKES